MKFPIIYSPEFLDHDTGFGHPESAARLKSVVAALNAPEWIDRLEWLSPTAVGDRSGLMPLIEQVHTTAYLDRLQKLAKAGGGRLDPDTIVSPRSYDVALLAVSAWLDGIDRICQTDDPVFVLSRPPGHHALRDRGMGFCLLANAAIAANYALQQPNIKKVAILDWDVHHGNGTQLIVEQNPHICYCSLHQSPCYPNTGMSDERGIAENVLNLPVPPQIGPTDYHELFENHALPFLANFEPDLIIVSAGYDAHQDDPLADLTLLSEDYAQIIKKLLRITGRLLIGLEGGYHLKALARSVAATIDSCITQSRE
jgi:acetoin utilization deacetylase AcuC-like enzyme